MARARSPEPMLTTTGVVRASCTHPAGSTITPVTWAANDGGRVEADRQAAGSLGDRTHRADGRAARSTGAIPQVAPASGLEHPAVRAHRGPLFPPAGYGQPGVSSTTAMWTPSGQRHVHRRRGTHGSSSSAPARPGVTSSNGGWPAVRPAATTWAAVSCTLPATVTESAANMGGWSEDQEPMTWVIGPTRPPRRVAAGPFGGTAVRRAEDPRSHARRAPAAAAAPPRPLPRRTRLHDAAPSSSLGDATAPVHRTRLPAAEPEQADLGRSDEAAALRHDPAARAP